jgi:ketosteroid isomerase-like protein
MFANGTINARPERVRRLQTHACAVHSVLEHIELMTPDGPQSAWVMATNVYVKAAQGWRLVAHHASPGAGREPQDDGEPAAVLH